jgi:hypothetical protein
MSTIADVTEIAAVLNRRRGLELAGLRELPLDVPMRTTISGRIEEGTLKGRHRPVSGTLTPARDTGKSVLGSRAKSGAIMR